MFSSYLLQHCNGPPTVSSPLLQTMVEWDETSQQRSIGESGKKTYESVQSLCDTEM